MLRAPRVLALALAALVAAATPGAAAAAPDVIADDYPRARAEALRLGVPILVDVWAPW